MSIRARFTDLALTGLAIATSAVPGEAMASRPQSSPLQVRCTAAGAKLLAPAMTAEAICARFSAAIRTAAAPGDALSIELKFLPNGIATALVSRTRSGKAGAQMDFNLAVSDRHFAPHDLDRLAADVAAGLRKNP